MQAQVSKYIINININQSKTLDIITGAYWIEYIYLAFLKFKTKIEYLKLHLLILQIQ